MRPVGIVTFHRSPNYGAVLQAYALQKTMEALGADARIMDYYDNAAKARSRPWFYARDRFTRILQVFLLGAVSALKRARLIGFLKQGGALGKETYKTYYKLQAASKDYAFFIAGSDQVFCPTLGSFDPVYYLTFAKAARYSYAASFGMEKLPLECVSEYQKRLSGFRTISVREESGVKIVEDLFGPRLKAQVHIDPVLLIGKEAWESIAPPEKERAFILVYTVTKPDRLLSHARSLSGQTGLKVLYINDSYYRREPGIKKIPAVSPQRFVGLFKSASYVLTNSFHGTAFSILLHKTFAVEPLADGGKNGRITHLLRLTGLEGRWITEAGLPFGAVRDWDAVDQRLEIERGRSLEYLQKIIRENQ